MSRKTYLFGGVLVIILLFVNWGMSLFHIKLANQALLSSIRMHDLAGIERALRSGASPNTRDSDGSTALMLAIAAGAKGRPEVREHMVKRLIGAGANVNASGRHRMTALMNASVWNSPACAAYLLEAGADWRAKNDEGMTASDLASLKGSSKVLTTLRIWMAEHSGE